MIPEAPAKKILPTLLRATTVTHYDSAYVEKSWEWVKFWHIVDVNPRLINAEEASNEAIILNFQNL